jgi:anti-sigma regulatory factor (Ser/Thr protein kinase)
MASREARADGGTPDPGGGPDISLAQPFDRDGLYTLRAAVAAHASHLGASPERVAHLVIVVSELASNAVRHGGGTGRLRLWRVDDGIRCEVRDTGPGLADPDRAGMTPPSTLAIGGRGLWIVRQLSTAVHIDSNGYGTTVTATVSLERPEG